MKISHENPIFTKRKNPIFPASAMAIGGCFNLEPEKLGGNDQQNMRISWEFTKKNRNWMGIDGI